MSAKKRGAVGATKGKRRKAATKKKGRNLAPNRPGRPSVSKKAARPRTNVTEVPSEVKGPADSPGRNHDDDRFLPDEHRDDDHSAILNAATHGSPLARANAGSCAAYNADDDSLDVGPEGSSLAADERSPAGGRRREQSLQARFAGWSIAQLRDYYFELVQRPTGSEDRAYLTWKINEAEKGRVKIGPRQTRPHEGPRPDIMVIPFRVERDLVAAIDEVWRSLGLRSRMELFRRAFQYYLRRHGAKDVAARFDVAGS